MATVTIFYFLNKLQLKVEMDETFWKKRYFKKSSFYIFKKIFSFCLERKEYKDILECCGFWRSSIKAPTSFTQLPKEERNKYPKSDTVCLVFDNNPFWMYQMTFWGLWQNSLALDMKYISKSCFWLALIFGKEKKGVPLDLLQTCWKCCGTRKLQMAV